MISSLRRSLFALISTALLAGCLGEQRTGQPINLNGVAGTLMVSTQNAGELGLAASRFVPHAENILHQLDPDRSDSELAKLNKVGASARLPLSFNVFRALDLGRHYSERSGRAYDYTSRSIAELWREGAPDDQTLQEALSRTGIRYVESSNGGAISFTAQDVSIDPGDLALAYAIDAAGVDLRDNMDGPFRLDFPGFTRLAGNFPDQQTVLIRDPANRSLGRFMLDEQYPGLVVRSLVEIALLQATSTNPPPPRVDPRTGRPANGAALVAVAGPFLTKAYALAEALLVTGWTGGRDILQHFEDCEALVIDPSGALHTTPGFAARFETSPP